MSKKKLSLSEQFDEIARIINGKTWQTAKNARIYIQQQNASVWYDFDNSTKDNVGFPSLQIQVKDCHSIEDPNKIFAEICNNLLPETLAIHIFCDTMDTAKAEKSLLHTRKTITNPVEILGKIKAIKNAANL